MQDQPTALELIAAVRATLGLSGERGRTGEAATCPERVPLEALMLP